MFWEKHGLRRVQPDSPAVTLGRLSALPGPLVQCSVCPAHREVWCWLEGGSSQDLLLVPTLTQGVEQLKGTVSVEDPPH